MWEFLWGVQRVEAWYTWQLVGMCSFLLGIAGAHQSQRGCLLKGAVIHESLWGGCTQAQACGSVFGDSRPSTSVRVHLCSSMCKPGGRRWRRVCVCVSV